MKKIFFIIISLPILFLSCTSGTQQQDKENVELITKYVKAVESKDFKAMEEFLADDYIGLGPSFGDTIYKKDAIENWKYNVENLYETLHYNRAKLAPVSITEGDFKGQWVGFWSELHIVYKDSSDVTIWANSDYLVENGKIKRSLTFYNEADALRQLGYKIVPAGE
jgi:ketosteroid isomerase-like protein